MNQLQPAGRAPCLPRSSCIVRKDEYAVHNSIAAADGPYNPALLLVEKPDAIEFDTRAVKFVRKKTARLAPARAAILSSKDRIARKQEPVFLIAKVDIIDSFSGADNLPYPRATAIVSSSEKAIVTPDPAAFAIQKVDRIQIALRWSNASDNPACLCRS